MHYFNIDKSSSFHLYKATGMEFRISKSEIPIELKPISLPRTFLDLNYNDEDEVDSDYQPRNDECVGDDQSVCFDHYSFPF